MAIESIVVSPLVKDLVQQANFNQQVNEYINTTILGKSGVLKVTGGQLLGGAILNDVAAPTSAYDFNNQDLTDVGNLTLNKNSTATFFTVTSGTVSARFESFGAAAYAALGTTTSHDFLLFTHGAANQFRMGNFGFWSPTGNNLGRSTARWGTTYTDELAINGSMFDPNADTNINSLNGFPGIWQNYGAGFISLIMRSARGTEGSPSQTLAEDITMSVSGRSHNGTDWNINDAACILGIANENQTSTAQGHRLEAKVTIDGNNSKFTAWIVSNDGTFTVGAVERVGLFDIYAGNFFNTTSIGYFQKTRVITVGYPGATGVDFNLANNADSAEQNLDLGDIIPAFSQLYDCMIRCTETVAGGTVSALNVALGTTSSGEEILADSVNDTLDDISEPATGSGRILASSASSRHLYGQFNIASEQWNNLTAGKWKIYINYIDNAGL